MSIVDLHQTVKDDADHIVWSPLGIGATNHSKLEFPGYGYSSETWWMIFFFLLARVAAQANRPHWLQMDQAYVPLRQFLYTASSAPNLAEMLRFHWVVLILGRLSLAASITSTFRSREALYASLVPTAFSSRVSGTCRHDSLFYFESLLNQTAWAWKSKSLVSISTFK